jgi:hypothetical protein
MWRSIRYKSIEEMPQIKSQEVADLQPPDYHLPVLQSIKKID